MTIIFTLLLAVFSIISAFITYLFTSSLATNATTLIAFAALGFAFDALKSLLPAAVFNFLDSRKYSYASLCLLVCMLLVSFSLYASFQLLDKGAQVANTSTTAYELKAQQIEQVKIQQAKFLEFDKVSLAKSLNGELAELQRELLALPAPATAGKNAQLIANIVLSILVELSIFACHVARQKADKSSGKKLHQSSNQKSSSSQLQQGAAGAFESTKLADKGAFNALQISELAQIILQRGDANLTYRQLESKYKISSGKVRDIKQYLQQQEQQPAAAAGLSLVQ